jgi:hypothetical protein
MHTWFGSECVKERGHRKDIGIDGKITIKWILKV